MSDKPILFSGPMVRALLAGTKTQTRRGLSLARYRGFTEFGPSDTKGYDWHLRDSGMRWHDLRHAEMLARLPWHVGDRLYVRETWTHTGTGVWTIADTWHARDGEVIYQADGPIPGAKYWPSIHMPRSYSRLTLTVTEVRVERLQDCSEADALSEGVVEFFRGPDRLGWPAASADDVIAAASETGIDGPVSMYRDLWNSINGGGAWEANPWVAAYGFTVERGNIDRLAGRA